MQAALKARELHTNTTINETERVFLSHADILVFRGRYEILTGESSAEDDEVYRRMRDAMLYLCSGFNFGGGLCSQSIQLVQLVAEHQLQLQLYRSRTQGFREEVTDIAPDWQAALRACFFAVRGLQVKLMQEDVRAVPMGSRHISFLSLSFLRMRLAFKLRDDMLVGMRCVCGVCVGGGV